MWDLIRAESLSAPEILPKGQCLLPELVPVVTVSRSITHHRNAFFDKKIILEKTSVFAPIRTGEVYGTALCYGGVWSRWVSIKGSGMCVCVRRLCYCRCRRCPQLRFQSNSLMTQVPILIVHQSVLGSIRYALGSLLQTNAVKCNLRTLILFVYFFN